jgi:ABC-type glycerol-3-phosphate transport system substrate-binding protein
LINTKDPWQSLIPLLWAEGGAIFSEDGERCLLDSLVAVRAAQLVRRTAEFSLPAGGLTPWECWDAFAAGRAALIACGTYGYQYFNKLGVRWVARPLPHGKHRAGAVRVLGFGLSRRAMHRPAAVEFLRAIADYELWPARRVQPVALPLHKELERDGETERVYRRALTYGRTILSDIAPQYRNKIHAQALAIIEKYHMPLLVHGQAPVEEIMWSMSREANRMISIAAKSREEVL